MWIARSKTELRNHLKSHAQKVILVPTMGALHEGHLALIRKAKELATDAEHVVISIFVNPLQFNQKADLEKYPRDLARDLELCKSEGADGIFSPHPDEMYASDRSISVIENSLANHLCGSTRPGHFDGVCTVVLKLFHLTQCRAAIFGQKDFQQLAIIQRMIRDLDLNVDIIPHPTLRHQDGLAMSSRNARLSPPQRKAATLIRKGLLLAKKTSSPEAAISTAKEIILSSPAAKIDYLSVVDRETLQPADSFKKPTTIACAVFYGSVRLIDHINL